VMLSKGIGFEKGRKARTLDSVGKEMCR
jgi:hypothetical protein